MLKTDKRKKVTTCSIPIQAIMWLTNFYQVSNNLPKEQADVDKMLNYLFQFWTALPENQEAVKEMRSWYRGYQEEVKEKYGVELTRIL